MANPKTILTIFLFAFMENSIMAQVDTESISKIQSYTKYIDSMSDENSLSQSVYKSIAEGTIKEEIVSAPTNGNLKQEDTTRKIRTGGFGKYTIGNKFGDTAYRLLYHSTIYNNLYEIFYYRDNRLVYAKIEYKDDFDQHMYYQKEEYYKDKQILFSSESKNPIDDESKVHINFNLHDKGYEYLFEFLKDRNSR